jgi:phosphoenolpyruvate carboxykinase (GTP)
MRVLKWIVERTHGRVDACETPLGWVPGPRDFDLGEMKDFNSSKMAKAQEIGVEDWRREALLHEDLFLQLYADLPKELLFERELLISRL